MRCITILLLLFSASCLSAAPQLSAELSHGLQLMNDGQLLEAYSLLHDYKEKHPDEEEGIFLLALTKWKMMWLSTYDRADREELVELLDRVEGICRPTMNEDKDALFYYASVMGVRAELAATEDQWWDTAQLGKKMKNTAEKLIKMDPDYTEAYYLLGSYNYFADALPGYIKFLRTLMFVPGGDRITGLKQLIVAYQKGGIVSGEAGRTLAIIYTYYEQRHDYGTQMCDNLLTTYPGGFDVGLYKGINLYFSMSWEKSFESLQRLRNDVLSYSTKHVESQNHGEQQVVAFYLPLEREAKYWIARSLIQMHRYEEARSILSDLANPPIHQPYWLIRWVYLSLAQIEYQSDHSEAAENWLSRVLAWKDVKDSQDKARLLKKKKGQVDYFDIDFR